MCFWSLPLASVWIKERHPPPYCPACWLQFTQPPFSSGGRYALPWTVHKSVSAARSMFRLNPNLLHCSCKEEQKMRPAQETQRDPERRTREMSNNAWQCGKWFCCSNKPVSNAGRRMFRSECGHQSTKKDCEAFIIQQANRQTTTKKLLQDNF